MNYGLGITERLLAWFGEEFLQLKNGLINMEN